MAKIERFLSSRPISELLNYQLSGTGGSGGTGLIIIRYIT
jgi:hypothetical protein